MAAILAVCAPVQPRERYNFAKSQMALEPYPLQSALRAHNYVSREERRAAMLRKVPAARVIDYWECF